MIAYQSKQCAATIGYEVHFWHRIVQFVRLARQTREHQYIWQVFLLGGSAVEGGAINTRAWGPGPGLRLRGPGLARAQPWPGLVGPKHFKIPIMAF